MERRVAQIEVGTHDQHVGYTIVYDGGEREHFLFSRPTARQLVKQLTKLLDDLDYVERQIPLDTVRVGESVQVRLTGGDA